MPNKILNVAHRGASAYEPENTLRAFRRAYELGADLCEIDLHLSKDGELIVMHNADVDHTTDGHGLIAEMTLAEIKQLDAGEGESVPTLQEVVELVRGRGGLYIELKAAGTPRATVDLPCPPAPTAPASARTLRSHLARATASVVVVVELDTIDDLQGSGLHPFGKPSIIFVVAVGHAFFNQHFARGSEKLGIPLDLFLVSVELGLAGYGGLQFSLVE